MISLAWIEVKGSSKFASRGGVSGHFVLRNREII